MRSRKFIGSLLASAAIFLLSQCFSPPISEGERLYKINCMSCHLEDGSGLRNVIPPLAKADFLVNHRDQLACLIQHGIDGPIVVNGVTFNRPMPGAEHLSEMDIYNLLNYIQKNFGNENPPFSLDEIKQALDKCKH